MPKIGDTVYYENEHEEHSDLVRKAPIIDEHFVYLHKNPLWRICAFIVYRFIMIPFAFLWCKIRFHHTIKNKRVLRGFRRRGLFLYGNHTLMSGDAYIPNILMFPKNTYVIISPQNLSVRGTRNYLQMCGGIPIPTTIAAFRNFKEALEKRTVQRSAVVIYPEAHIWPYYTGIRPFDSGSFAYPIRFDEPSFCFTNTYHRKRFSKTPRVITYLDGPFYPNTDLPRGERAQDLSDRISDAMKARAALSTYHPITYIQREAKDFPVPHDTAVPSSSQNEKNAPSKKEAIS